MDIMTGGHLCILVHVSKPLKPFSKVQRYNFLQVTILIDPKRKDAIDKQIKQFLYSHAGANYAQYSKWSTRPFQHVRFFSFLKCKLTNILCFDKTWSWSLCRQCMCCTDRRSSFVLEFSLSIWTFEFPFA